VTAGTVHSLHDLSPLQPNYRLLEINPSRLILIAFYRVRAYNYFKKQL